MYKATKTRILTLTALFLAVLLLPATSYAQSSGLAVYSPYTMYGIGDLSIGGNAFNRSMGGVGIGLRNGTIYNYLNPASLSSMPRHTALFNFGAEGNNTYSKTAAASTSYNYFNIHDIGLAVPLYKGIGLGFSLTPVSSVGYHSIIVNNNEDIVSGIGRAVYEYNGSGGLSQVSMNFGIHIAKGLSLGASLQYLFGNLDRQYSSSIGNYIGENFNYHGVFSQQQINVSKLMGNIGLQYSFLLKENSTLTLGFVYQPKVNLTTRLLNQTLSTSATTIDTVSYEKSRGRMSIPTKISAGLFYQGRHFGVGFDYNRQNWKGAFGIPADQNVSLGVQEEYKLGISYLANPYDIHSAFKRWTYKVGVRYGTNYLKKDGYTTRDYAVSVGADIPLKKFSNSKVGIGFEYGRRGTTSNGQIRENYWRVFAAFGLFGEDFWFYRPQYD